LNFHQGMLLEPGRYHLEISRNGCNTENLWVNLEPGKSKTLRVQLQWVVSQLFIQTEPENAQVKILNHNREFQQGMILKSGRYDVEVSCEGYQARNFWIDLTPGEKNRFKVKLESLMSRLWVRCVPEDAKIRILNIKEKFQQGIIMKPGRYHLEISREGYHTENEWVNLNPGDKNLAFELKKVVVETTTTSPPPASSAPARHKQKSTERFLYDNGVIRDYRTGLEWRVGPNEPTTFSEAQEWLKKSNMNAWNRQWRIPSITELQTLYNKWKGTSRNIPELFRTTGWYVWAFKSNGSNDIALFSFRDGGPVDHKFISASHERVFGVRTSNAD